MIQMTVDDFKAQYERTKKPVATLTHIEEKPKKKRRPLGLYEGKATYWEDENFPLTPEYLFDDMDDLMR